MFNHIIQIILIHHLCFHLLLKLQELVRSLELVHNVQESHQALVIYLLVDLAYMMGKQLYSRNQYKQKPISHLDKRDELLATREIYKQP